MHSQQMASIAPIVIGCIDYLAYGTIFTRVIFRPKIKLDVFFPARKAADERWEVVWWWCGSLYTTLDGSDPIQIFHFASCRINELI